MPQRTSPTPVLSPRKRKVVKAARPSLVDLRFKGDPWVVDHQDGTAALCLGDYPMLQIGVSALDLPSLNRLLQQVRVGQARRQACARVRRVD